MPGYADSPRNWGSNVVGAPGEVSFCCFLFCFSFQTGVVQCAESLCWLDSILLQMWSDASPVSLPGGSLGGRLYSGLALSSSGLVWVNWLVEKVSTYIFGPWIRSCCRSCCSSPSGQPAAGAGRHCCDATSASRNWPASATVSQRNVQYVAPEAENMIFPPYWEGQMKQATHIPLGVWGFQHCVKCNIRLLNNHGSRLIIVQKLKRVAVRDC